MAEQFKKKKQLLGFVYGLLAGFAFSVAAWGIDSIVLATAHVSYAWVKFVPGLIIAMSIGGLFGWLSSKISKGYITIPLWLIFGFFLAWLITWLPFFSSPVLIKYLSPNLIEWIDYPMVSQINQFRILGTLLIVLPSVICGLLENNIIDTMLMSSHKGAILAIVMSCSVLMGLAGFAGDELINKHFREPATALENLFDYALEHQGEEIDPKVARRLHLSTVKGLEDIISRPRKMTLIAYDNMLAQMDFLVDFNGIWVKCSTIYSQPTMCEEILWIPIIYCFDNQAIMKN